MRSGLPGLDKRELAYGTRYGTSHINAAFAYSRPKVGNRFNDDTRGAWYCAFDCKTAIKEIAYHLIRELDWANAQEDEFIYQELLAGFIGEFHDARKLPRNKGVLGTDPETAYPLGQELARKIMAEGGCGIVYPSVRRPKGTCFVAFYPQMVQNLRYGARWKLSWNESNKIKAEEIS